MSLKRAARNGSIPAMKELATRAMGKNQLAHIFPLVKQHLSSVPTRNEASIQMALICFDSLIFGLENALVGKSATLLVPLWHSIRPWLSFFITQFPLDLTEAAVDDHEALLKSTKLVNLFVQIPEVLPLLASVPHFVGHIFTMSLIAASVDYDSEILKATSKTITIISAAAEQLDQGWQDDASRILSSKAPDKLALGTVQRLIELAEKPQISYPDLIARLEILLFCSGNDGRLRLQFFSKQSVAWVTFVMGRLTRPRNLEPSNLPLARRAIYLSVMYLKKSLKVGFTWVSDALDKGILQSIVKAQPYLVYDRQKSTPKNFTVESSIVFILDTITLLAVYRSVLHRARTSLRRAEVIEDALNLQGPVNDAWLRLKEKVDRLWSLRPVYYVARNGAACCMSDNCTTRREGDTSSRARDMRCSGCQYAYYCSYKCAQSGWRDGHRKQCIELQRQFREGYPRLMSPSEDEWFIVIGQSEVYRTPKKEAIDAMRKAYSDAHPSAPDHSILTFLDYTVLPGPKIEVISLHDFVGTRNMGYYRWEMYRDWAMEKNGFLLGITMPDRDLEPYNCLALSLPP
ncbi:hypothetical protein IW261DRAFT_1568056 [Armillaria novae-zelandiae]|uniref:MYND-type domain-containing protein n=1 Tax=Armillaria novae-zelandiae TaxID=153914 RepID=A0AA39U660_9AGAR|nr:hypothetical protein IW261DRAFT_1568056 [Armillaria novae-zelandiae]